MFLNFVQATSSSGPIAEDSQQNHHQERDEDYDDGDLNGHQQETDQRDQLFQQSDDKENEGNDGADSAKSLKNAATHINSTPKVITAIQDLRSKGSGVTSPRAN